MIQIIDRLGNSKNGKVLILTKYGQIKIVKALVSKTDTVYADNLSQTLSVNTATRLIHTQRIMAQMVLKQIQNNI